MWKMQLFEKLDFVTTTNPDRGGGPFAHSIDGQNGSFLERRRKKGAGSMCLMMLREEQGAVTAQSWNFLPNGFTQIELLAQPAWDHLNKRLESGWSHSQVAIEHPRKFRDRFVVENNPIQV